MRISGEGAVMTTLEIVPKKSKPGPSAEEAAAQELVRLAREQGLSLTGPAGLLKQFTKSVLETALNEEMTEHLGHVGGTVPTPVQDDRTANPGVVVSALLVLRGLVLGAWGAWL